VTVGSFLPEFWQRFAKTVQPTTRRFMAVMLVWQGFHYTLGNQIFYDYLIGANGILAPLSVDERKLADMR
jgi:hypothetical protein